jgi:hypothetical protein
MTRTAPVRKVSQCAIGVALAVALIGTGFWTGRRSHEAADKATFLELQVNDQEGFRVIFSAEAWKTVLAAAPGMTTLQDDRLHAKINAVVEQGFVEKHMFACARQWTAFRLDYGTEDGSVIFDGVCAESGEVTTTTTPKRESRT